MSDAFLAALQTPTFDPFSTFTTYTQSHQSNNDKDKDYFNVTVDDVQSIVNQCQSQTSLSKHQLNSQTPNGYRKSLVLYDIFTSFTNKVSG